MKIGLFDHLEHSGRPLATLFDERLDFVAAIDAAGFWGYHVAEHHATPLNMVPVPGVFLGAVARQTRQLRLGPLCYLLPLYSPLRLIEEICMLDHLSKGRLELGIGRGVSPFELNFHKVAHTESREIFFDAYACLCQGLGHDVLDHAGNYYTYTNVPMALRPLQTNGPAFWYGSSNAVGAQWAGEQGMQFVANGPTALAAGNIAAFRAALATRGAPAHPKADFPGGAAIGLLRHIVVADTDDQAERIARPAFSYHLASLNHLRKRHAEDVKILDQAQRAAGLGPGAHQHQTYDDCVAAGMVIAGTPDTVRRAIVAQAETLGINYLVTYLFFGDMAASVAHRSLQLFHRDVMPALAGL